jgi:ABC-type ATPase with predicted acetyltransferase domain
MFPDSYITEYTWSKKSIIDDMPSNKSIDEIVKTFNSVGFSTPISWLKPYSVLSNGEKMRVDLAKAILSENSLVVFDEFTSVVDRNIAKIGSYAVQKAIRKTDKKFIAVGCHFDVEEWLQPDWVFNTNTMTFFVPEKKSPNFTMNYGKQWINQCGKCLVSTII